LGKLPLITQRVRVAILNGIARTETELEFENTQPTVVEGLLTFPLPPQATLSRLAMGQGEHWTDGDVVDDDQRFHLPQGKLHGDYWLSEPKRIGSHGGDVLRGVVVPLAANAKRKLLLAYDQAPAMLGTRDVFRFPMSIEPGTAGAIAEFALEVTLFGSPAHPLNITTPGYPTELRREADRTIVTFRAQRFRPERDFLIQLEHPDVAALELAADVPSWGNVRPQHDVLAGARQSFSAVEDPAKPLGHFAASLRLATSVNSATLPVVARNRVVIVDKSASQSGTTFEIERQLVKAMLERTKPDEHLSVFACDSACERWPAENGTDLMTWLNRLAPSGASDFEGAIATAALSVSSNRANQIVWLSDGQASAGDLEPKSLIERIARWISLQAIDLRLIGIGEQLDNSFLMSVAKAVGATYDVVTTGRTLEEQIAAVASALDEPKIIDLKLAFPAGIKDVRPSVWPGMRLGQSLNIAGRLTAPVRGVLQITGKLSGKNYEQQVPIAIEPETTVSNPLVGRRFAALEIDERESNLEHARLAFGVSALSRTARVASRHTGWLVPVSASLPARTQHPPAGILPLKPAGMFSQSFDWRRSRISSGRFWIHGRARIGPVETDGSQLLSRETLRGIDTTFWSCYPNALLLSGDQAEGAQQWLLRLAPNGQIESIAVEGMRNPLGAEFAECIRHNSVDMPLTEREARPLEVRLSTHVHIDWSRGSEIWPVDLSVPQPPGWGPSMVKGPLSLETAMTPGNEGWRNSKSTNRALATTATRGEREVHLRSLLKRGQLARALSEAERLIAVDPNDQAALELMAMAAGALQDRSRSTAALEALLELRADADNIRLALAQAYLVLGDERRACAHLRGIRAKTDELLANALRCRYRWFREGHTPMVEVERLEFEAGNQPQPQFWQVENDITKGIEIGPPRLRSEFYDFQVFVTCDESRMLCPEAVVVTPAGDVVSALVPMPGKAQGSPLAFWMKTKGTYRILLVGGERRATGSVEVRAAGADAKEFRFSRGGEVQTVASVTVRADEE
jgi:tetratricopeptide (TPR) repeat protein